MTPEEKLNHDKLLVLEAIKYVQLLRQDDEPWFEEDSLLHYLNHQLPLDEMMRIIASFQELEMLIIWPKRLRPEEDEVVGYKLVKSIFEETYKRYKEIATSSPPKLPEKKSGYHIIKFDEGKGEIIIDGALCTVSPKTIQYYLCAYLFSKPIGTRIPANDVAEFFDREMVFKEGRRTIYDAVRLINKHIEGETGIKNLFRQSNSIIWISEPTKK